MGETIPSKEIGDSYSKNFTIAIPASVANAANISFAAFVVDGNNTAINARSAKANIKQNYQENQ